MRVVEAWPTRFRRWRRWTTVCLDQCHWHTGAAHDLARKTAAKQAAQVRPCSGAYDDAITLICSSSPDNGRSPGSDANLGIIVHARVVQYLACPLQRLLALLPFEPAQFRQGMEGGGPPHFQWLLDIEQDHFGDAVFAE